MLGRDLRTTLPSAQGGVVHLFVVYGYQGSEEELILLLFPVLRSAFLLDGMLIWLLLILWVLVLLLMSFVGLFGRKVLVLVEISL